MKTQKLKNITSLGAHNSEALAVLQEQYESASKSLATIFCSGDFTYLGLKSMLNKRNAKIIFLSDHEVSSVEKLASKMPEINFIFTEGSGICLGLDKSLIK